MLSTSISGLQWLGAFRALGSYLDSFLIDLHAAGNRFEFSAYANPRSHMDRELGIERAMRTVLERREHALGAGVLFDAHSRYATGERMLWWNRKDHLSESQIIRAIPSATLEELELHRWYRRSIETGSADLTGPYIDVFGTGRFVNTFSAPLLRAGIPCGVIALTVDLPYFEGSLLKRLQRIKPEALLVSSDARIVCSASGRYSAGERLLEIPEGWSFQRVPSHWLELGVVSPRSVQT